MKKILIITILLLNILSAYAKVEIKGKVTDLEGTPLQGIMLRLYKDNKIRAFTSSKRDGTFLMKADTISFPAKITFASKSYAPHETWITNNSDSVFAVLEPQQLTLEEVVVKVPRVRMKGDTITYDVASYTGKGDRSIEDVIKKLPGIEVADNGTIMYDGEPINNFYIEGLNLMGNNYAIASRNITPQDISTVSVYERHQPKKALKGIAESKKAALNLKLKKGRMLKPVGYLKGGAGYGDETLWTGQLYTMLVSPTNQTILSASGNNTGNDYLNPNDRGDKAFTTFARAPFGTPSLASSRYMNNRSAYFTANTLFKLKEDLTFTFNSSYGLDHDGFDGMSTTEYLASGLTDPIYSEKVDNGLKKHIVTASAKIENNSDKLYLKDQFYFTGYFNNNSYGIVNTSPIDQTMHNRHFSFFNDFSTIIRKGYNATEITSQTSYSHTPFSNIAASDIMSGTQIMRQNVEGRSFYNRETTGYSRKVSRKSSIGADLAFQINHDKFISFGQKEESAPVCNDLSGHILKTSVSPFYKFSIPGKFSVTFTLPIEWRDLKYTDIVNEKTHRFDKIFVNGNLDIFFKPHQSHWFDANAGWSHDTGDITNFIDNPIFTTFRNTSTLGNGSLVKTTAKSARISYSFRNPFYGFYLRGMASFSRKETNSLSVTNVDQSGTSNSTLNSKTHNDITNVMINATKHLTGINSRLSLNLTGVWMQRESMRSSSLINIKNATYIATLKAETEQFDNILAMSANLSYSLSHQSFGSAVPSNDIREFSVNGKISVFPIKRLEIYGKVFLNRSQLEEDNYKSNVFIDAGARFSIKKFDIELTARNLTDMRKYEYTLYHTLDLTTYSYSIRPIEGILTLRYNF